MARLVVLVELVIGRWDLGRAQEAKAPGNQHHYPGDWAKQQGDYKRLLRHGSSLLISLRAHLGFNLALCGLALAVALDVREQTVHPALPVLGRMEGGCGYSIE